MNRCLSGLLLAFGVLGMALALVPNAGAQATTGSIAGRVTDRSKAVIVGAEVTALNQATGVSYPSKSNGEGNFEVQRVPPGIYSVTVTQQGFERAVAKDLELFIDQKLVVDFELKVGTTSTTETVRAEAPLLQTESEETGQVIESKQILDLPLLGRNFLQLSLLAPGVVSGEGGNTLNLSVNGEREFANSVVIDGVEATANRNNDTNLRPSVDAVEEFKVATSDYSAEFGRAAGGVISIQTKAGTNKYHGDLYDFYRPNATAADNYSFSGAGQSPELSQHNFGGTFGGPIVKDKTFFFVSYEQERLRQTLTYLDSVPPQNQIVYNSDGSVNLSGLLDPGNGQQLPIFNPAFYAQNFYSQQFPGNVIPACPANFTPDGSCVSPAGLAVLQDFFPKPTLPGIDFGYYNNFLVNAPYAYDGKTASVRFDHDFSKKDHVSVVYHYGGFNDTQDDPFHGATPVVGAGATDQGLTQNSRSQELSATETHLFSQRLLNEFRFGYSRYRLNDYSLLNGQNLATQYGMPDINLPGFPATSGFPQVYLGDGYETGGSTYLPLYFLDSNFQFQDNVVVSLVGKHEFHFGTDFRRLNSHPNFNLFPTGFQYYSGPYQYAPGGPLSAAQDYSCCASGFAYYQGGSDIADLLLGLPQYTNIGLQFGTTHTRSWELHFYGEDTYKVTPRLTLIYGVRYQYQNPYTEAGNNLSNFDPVTNLILIAGRGGNSDALINARKNDFSPRLGLAFKLTPRTVMRAGYGLFYTPENDAREDVLSKNYPFATQQLLYTSPYFYPLSTPPGYQIDTGFNRTTTLPLTAGQSTINPADIVDPGTGVPDGNQQTVYYVDPHLKTGYASMYNLTVQRELSSTMSLEVGYVGSVSRDLPYAIGNINPGGIQTANLGKIEAQKSLGWGSFNSLQVKLNKRASRNLSLLASYTYGHNIDNGPAPFDLGVNHNSPQNPFDLNIEKASSDTDVRHNLVVSSIYSLPFGHHKTFGSDWNGTTDLLLGGWQLAGIFTARTGLPVNVVRNGNNTLCPGVRPNLVGDPNAVSGGKSLLEYFNTGAFSSAGLTGTCLLGDAGRNLVRGPGYINGDFSVFKNFRVKETYTLQTRFEFFNVTNTPHFANPGGDQSQTASFGIIRGTIANPRIVQFAAKFIF
ncbi:MAG: carboxypeptidase regulatory-like domain-containing protein [Candidatus Sulfotelmatobacter sp.]|jgi:hypothetical protein